MSAPTDDTIWATDATAEIAEPSSGEKQVGWVHGNKPPAHWFNWWMRAVYRWITYYGTKDAADGIVGLDANKTATIAGGASASGPTLAVTALGTDVDAVQAQGHGTGSGLLGAATSTSGSAGVKGAGNGTGTYGGRFQGGSGAGLAMRLEKGSTATDALKMDGNVDMSAAANPAVTDGFSNRLTPKNIPKAFVTFTGNGASAPTVNDGFNIASVTRNSNSAVTIAFGTALANANYAVNVNIVEASGIHHSHWSYGTKSTSAFQIETLDNADSPITNSGLVFWITFFGQQ